MKHDIDLRECSTPQRFQKLMLVQVVGNIAVDEIAKLVCLAK